MSLGSLEALLSMLLNMCEVLTKDLTASSLTFIQRPYFIALYLKFLPEIPE